MKATFELELYQIQRMIELAAPEYARELALQQELSKNYDLKGASKRLNVCTKSISNLITKGRLRYTPFGKNGKLISELACREFMGDVKIAS